jgi:UDP-N-acetyl-D-galactosamine dehydrogenase
VLVMGVTFKENVADIRNSKVADLVKELMQYAVNVHLVDHHASPNEFAHEYGLTLMDKPSNDYDAVILAVNHDEYRQMDGGYFKSLMKDNPILMDLKAVLDPAGIEAAGITYWRL